VIFWTLREAFFNETLAAAILALIAAFLASGALANFFLSSTILFATAS